MIQHLLVFAHQYWETQDSTEPEHLVTVSETVVILLRTYTLERLLRIRMATHEFLGLLETIIQEQKDTLS